MPTKNETNRGVESYITSQLNVHQHAVLHLRLNDVTHEAEEFPRNNSNRARWELPRGDLRAHLPPRTVCRGCTPMILSGRATFWKHLVVPNCQFVMQFAREENRVNAFQRFNRSLYGAFRARQRKTMKRYRRVIISWRAKPRDNIISALVPPLHLMRHQLKRHYNGANGKTWTVIIVIIRNSRTAETTRFPCDIIIPRGRSIYNFVKIRRGNRLVASLERVHVEFLMGRQATGKRTHRLAVRASVCENFS